MLTFSTQATIRTPIETLAVAVCEDGDIYADKQIQALIAKATRLEEFSGETKQQVTLYDPEGTKIHRCVFHGLGPRKEITSERLRVFAGQAARAAQSAKSAHLVLAVPDAGAVDLDACTVMTALFEGAFLGNHTFETYKQIPKQNRLKKIVLRVPAATAKQHAGLPAKIETICQNTLQAREWVNTPSNDKPPETLAKLVTAAGKTGLKVSVLHKAQLQRQKFGALLAVAAGSANPPCLVEMVYTPAKTAKKTIALVGKGVTFDTGGINLKPSSGMEAMKADMSGAATVAATLSAVAQLKPGHRVVGILPLVENMPSGSATRPGDIGTSFSGKTVEIGNTDAEGRLILIDAMAYAIRKYKPDILIDLATLTGACVVALGEKIAAVFSRDDELARAVITSGASTFERCWRLPLPEDYRDLLKSDLADINNMSSTRYGGAITAALFLSEFVGETRWAHIDIAGPAFSKKAGDYCGPGGTGFGVRLLCDLIDRL
jgi:leucyl aminopeptidase